MTIKFIVLLFLYITVLAFSNCKSVKKASQPPMIPTTAKKIAFNPYLPKGNINFDEKIKIYIQIDTVQLKSIDNGIKFSIILINDLIATIKTINPLEFFHIRLWTDSLANIFPDQLSKAKYDSPLPFSFTSFTVGNFFL